MKTPSPTLTFQRFTAIIAATFILLFVYTALSKIFELSIFRGILAASPLLGRYAGPLSIILPATELIIASLLFFPSTRQRGLGASFVLMFLFTLYVGFMLISGMELPCSCGGVISHLSWTQHLFFNTFFTLLAAFGLWGDKLFIAINRGRQKPVEKSRQISQV